MIQQFIYPTPLYIDELRKNAGDLLGANITRSEVMANANRLVGFGGGSGVNLMASEYYWIESGKPFFHAFPAVVKALIKTPLHIKPEQIPKSIVHLLDSLCVKLPQPSLSEFRGVTHFFIRVTSSSVDVNGSGLDQNPCVAFSFSDVDAAFTHAIRFSETAETSEVGSDIESGADVIRRRNIVRVGLGVMMLAADPDYIKPVLLKADENKTTPLEERIERAKRRGVFGFSIGEDIERSPHFRRPHFATRWTGKGATIPKLVPVKGAVIGKEIMTTVPTGFEKTDVDAAP